MAYQSRNNEGAFPIYFHTEGLSSNPVHPACLLEASPILA